jgi:hypothetical protein
MRPHLYPIPTALSKPNLVERVLSGGKFLKNCGF